MNRRKFIKRLLLLATGTALLDAFWIEKFFIQTKHFYLGNATKDTNNLKLVQLSDLHLQSVNSQLRRLARNINKLKPNLIMITGDAIDKAENIAILDEFLGLIDLSIEKVAITGNWEYWGHIDLAKLAEVYQKHSGILLVNKTMQYFLQGKKISITGVDDFIGGYADFATAIKGYIPGDYHIILNHCPAYSDQIAQLLPKEVKADFILSGHTHGGQINILGYTPFLPQGSGKYVKGWYRENNPPMYVSKGIGTSILPARFGARAEVAVFHLEA